MEDKLWRRGDGSLWLNKGPINPVTDPLAAHAMANNGEKSVRQHLDRAERAKRGQGWVDPYLTVEEIRDTAEERVRSNIATQDINKAKLLFDLVKVELAPVDEVGSTAVEQNVAIIPES